MPKYKVYVRYLEKVVHYTTVEVEAASESDARDEVRQMDENGDLNFKEDTIDTDPANYEVVETITDEDQAMADMAHEYLGEG